MKNKSRIYLIASAFLILSVSSYSMHIMEGYLPVKWVLLWFALCAPFWIYGLVKLQKEAKGNVKKN